MERFRGMLMPPPFWIKDRGRWGEYLIRRVYHRRGYHCLAKNWRHGSGEIDLIMGSPEHVVFIEVKTRKSKAGLRVGDTLGIDQENRLLELARVYLKTWPQANVPWTFRLAVVRYRGRRIIRIEEATLA